MDALGHILDVTIRQTAHADSSVAEQIYVLLSKQEFTLRGRKTGEAKHPDLFSNVVPLARSSQFFQSLAEDGAHVDDSVGHRLEWESLFNFGMKASIFPNFNAP